MKQDNQQGPIDLSGALQNDTNPENISAAKTPTSAPAMRSLFDSTKNSKRSLLIFGIVLITLIVVVIFFLNSGPKENFSSSPQLPSPPENTPR